MNDPYVGDIIDVYGTPIQLSSIKNYRLRQIEYVLRPMYAERTVSKWGKAFLNADKHKIEFIKMDYYAAIVGEQHYRNAINEYTPTNFLESVGKTAIEAVQGVADKVFGGNQSKAITYNLLNAAGRSFTRNFEDIPAVLVRADGKTSEVYRKDELYPLLGEPIAPMIEMVPALEIYLNAGGAPYIFFGKGIQLVNIEQEYEKLRIAFEHERRVRLEREKNQPNFLVDLFNRILPQPQQAKVNEDMIVKLEMPEGQREASQEESGFAGDKNINP